MVTDLRCIRPGERAVVLEINTGLPLKQRLWDFGFIPGTPVRCGYRSPGGKVTALEFRGTVMAMRTRDLRDIRVER